MSDSLTPFQPMRVFIVAAMWTLLSCLVSCGADDGGANRADLHVVSFSPAKTVLDSREPIQFTFDSPVVGESEVGHALSRIPITVSPTLELEGRWVDRYTLSLKPVKGYAPSTEYEIALQSPISHRVKEEERVHSFVHDPIRFSSVGAVDVNAVPVNPRFTLRFSQEVKTSDVLASCAVYNVKSGQKISLKTTEPHKTASTIAVAPLFDLKKGTAYAVRCRALAPAVGNWNLPESEVMLTTYPEFGIVDALPKEKVIPPEANKVKIEFATPVAREEFEKNVVVKLNGKRISNNHWGRAVNGRVYKWDSFLEAVSKYEIWVKKGMADVYAQSLVKTKVIQFETTDAPPAISTETGISIIEAQTEGFQVWTRNVATLTVECAKISTERIAKVVASPDVDLYPWVSSSRSELDWRALKLRPKKEKRKIDAVKNKWASNKIDLATVCGDGTPGGFYLAQFTSPEVQEVKEKQGWGHYPYRVLSNTTDLGVVLKVGPASGAAWVTSMSTGEVVSGAKVTVYDVEGKKRFSGSTDSNGLAQLPGSAELKKGQKKDPNEYYDYYSAQRFVTVVEKSGDTAVVDGDWNSGIALWNFSIHSDRKENAKRIRGFIQSDRGIYKPGETVYFKALVRELFLNGMPQVPKGKAHVLIDDPSGVTLFDKKLPLSEFGSVDFQLTLNSEARLGDYYAKVEVEDQTFAERFSVEEFRPVSFEVKKDFEAKDKLVGQKIRFAFDADYLFGAPVKDAQVMWSVNQRRRHLSFPKYRGYSFSDSDSYYWDWYYDEMYDSSYSQSFVSDGTTQTDGNGRFSFSVRDQYAKDVTYPVDYIGRATVTDESDQSVTKTVVVRAHPTDVYLGVKSKSWIQKVKNPLELDVVAVDVDGRSLASDARLELHREEWECGSGPNYGYRCERKTEKVFSKDIHIEKDGSVESLKVTRPGDYMVKVLGKDSRGKKVTSSTSVWVTGEGYFFWGGEDNHKLTLIPSEEKYAPGDVARVIPKGSTEKSKLLVTLERNGIIDSFVIDGKESGGAIEIPIKESYAPNVYVSVSSVKPRTGKKDSERPTFEMGIVNLKVTTREKELKVRVETDKAEYEPGETVKGKVIVTQNGAPVVSELSVSVADEGVLQLIDYQTPNPIDTIYAPFGLGVDSSSNLLKLARFRNPVDDSEEGADGGENAEPQVRSKFVASAYWKPNLVTDGEGVARFEFPAPDNLTAFRVMAVAADKTDRFGSTDERIVVNKKLLVTPVLSRFFGSDDWVNIGAVIHNYSKKAGEVKVNWKVEGLWTKGSGETIALKKGESKRVEFTVKVSKLPQAKVRITAEMGALSDGFEMTLPIRRNITILQKQVYEGKTKDTGVVALQWPDDVEVKYSELNVSVDRFGLGMLGESLRYLVQYPYGCLEQTLSRLIPMFKARDLAKSMQLDELKGTKLQEFITFGVDKVFKHQHDDGHFSLWPDSTAEPHLTAYALWGLSEAQKAGVKINQHKVDLGIAALKRWVGQQEPSTDSGTASELAMVAFVLAHYGKSDAGLNARLFEARNGLTVYGKAFLLRAMISAQDNREWQQQLVNEILTAAKGTEAQLFVTENEALPYYMSSDVRTTALVISALLAYDDSMSEIPLLVEGLKAHRNEGGGWYNTQENIYSLIAISDFVRAQEPGDAEVTITMDGKKWEAFSVTGSKIVRVKRSLSQLKAGDMQVVSTSPVYVNVSMGLAREAAENKGESRGFTVTREMVDVKTGQPVTQVAVGTLVKVRLTVHSDESRNYVAVSDPLPAGFEAVNTRLATEDNSLNNQSSTNYYWDYVELRDDQVLAFTNRMYAGDRTIEYIMRATIGGTFSVPGTLAEEMYTPSCFGTSDERNIKVLK